MAGRLRHRLSLQQRAEALDSVGEAALSYTELAEVWGSLEAASARERFEAQQVRADVSHRIVVRHSAAAASLTPADRVVNGSTAYDVISVLDLDGRRKFLEIMALERL